MTSATVVRLSPRSEYPDVYESGGLSVGVTRRPTVGRPPSGPLAAVSAVVANRLLHRAAARLPLRLATWFVALPLQFSAVLGSTPRRLLPVTVTGVLVWAVGFDEYRSRTSFFAPRPPRSAQK